jgi:hypothetical protein
MLAIGEVIASIGFCFRQCIACPRLNARTRTELRCAQLSGRLLLTYAIRSLVGICC